MEYSLTTPYTPGPHQPRDVGSVKVIIEGRDEAEVCLKPGQILMEAAMCAMLLTGNITSHGLYWDGKPGHEPCEFVSFDPRNDRLVIRLKT